MVNIVKLNITVDLVTMVGNFTSFAMITIVTSDTILTLLTVMFMFTKVNRWYNKKYKQNVFSFHCYQVWVVLFQVLCVIKDRSLSCSAHICQLFITPWGNTVTLPANTFRKNMTTFSHHLNSSLTNVLSFLIWHYITSATDIVSLYKKIKKNCTTGPSCLNHNSVALICVKV